MTPEGDAVRQARIHAFRNLFGTEAEVVPHRAGDVPAVDVAIFPPGHGRRSFYTLATLGMSDLAMGVPEDLGRDCRRAELLMYVDQPGPSLVRLMQTIAMLPHRKGTWLGHGHTLPNGDPPAPLFPGSVLDTILVLAPIVAPERHARDHLQVHGDPLNLLWLMPITSDECRLKVEKGLSALLDVFNARELSFVLDPQRESLLGS